MGTKRFRLERDRFLGGCKPSSSGFKMNTHFASDQSFFQGHPSMARMCLLAAFFGLCLLQAALADEPASIPHATTQQVHQVVDRAIGYVQTESAAWLNTRKCAACHHAPLAF